MGSLKIVASPKNRVPFSMIGSLGHQGNNGDANSLDFDFELQLPDSLDVQLDELLFQQLLSLKEGA